MRKCNKCANRLEVKGNKMFCYYCKEYKMPYETYKFNSLINQLNK